MPGRKSGFANERHKTTAIESGGLDTSLGLTRQLQHLQLDRTNRRNHAAAFLQLPGQCGRDGRHRRRNDDAVKRSVRREAFASVSVDYHCICKPGSSKIDSRTRGKFGPHFHGEDFGGKQ